MRGETIGIDLSYLADRERPLLGGGWRDQLAGTMLVCPAAQRTTRTKRIRRRVHKGTCYRAAKWHYLGQTQVRGGWGNAPTKSPNAVFVYTLQQHLKAALLGADRPR